MKTLFFVFLSFYATLSFAQDSAARRKPITLKQLFRPSHVGFSIIPYVIQKAKVEKQSGNYSAGSDFMTGIEGGAEYRFNIKPNYSIIAGVHGGVSGRDYTLHIPKDEFSLPLLYDIDINAEQSRTYDFFLSAPVWIEKRWQCKNNNHWNLTAGINVRFYYGRLFEENTAYGYHTNRQPLRVFDMNLKVGNDAWPWINYNICAGYSFLLHNRDFLRVNLITNLSGFEPARGTYTIDVTGKELSTGSYSANLSYVGLSFTYILTGTGKQLRRFKPASLHQEQKPKS